MATTNLRFARAWELRKQVATALPAPKENPRDPYHHRLTRITRQVGSRTEVLHPLLT